MLVYKRGRETHHIIHHQILSVPTNKITNQKQKAYTSGMHMRTNQCYENLKKAGRWSREKSKVFSFQRTRGGGNKAPRGCHCSLNRSNAVGEYS